MADASDAELPKGASIRERFAEEIAGDRKRYELASKYWRDAFDKLGLSADKLADEPAIKFATLLPDKNLSALEPGQHRRSLFNGEGDRVIKESGCLLSLEEMAKAVDTTPSDLLRDVGAVLSATPDIGLGSEQQKNRGLRGIRELHDLIRRFRFCDELATTAKVPFSELLALFRQEGALVVPPPADSFAHAPLIRTRSQTCRTPDVDPVGVARPGFLLTVHQFKRLLLGANRDEDLTRSLILIISNLNVTGGLDDITNPRLPGLKAFQEKRGTPVDELLRTLIQVIPKLPAKGYVSRLTGVGGWRVLLGLLWAEVEFAEPRRVSDVELQVTMLRLSQIVSELVEAHTRLEDDTHPSDLFLSADISGKPTRLCLEVAVKWYASRGRPMTLLARRDRDSTEDLPEFGPFGTYLRYHLGDITFVGVLLRTIFHCPELIIAAQSQWKRVAPERAKGAIEEFVKNNGEAMIQAAAKALVVWKKIPSTVEIGEARANPRLPGDEERWHNLGLSKSQIALTGKPSEPGLAAKVAKNADIVRDLLSMLAKGRLLEGLMAILEWTSTKTLVHKGVMDGLGRGQKGLEALEKVHSFARLEETYRIYHSPPSQ
jgi:hypothetical protein